MLADLLPYLFLIVLVGSAAVLLTSRNLSGKFVAAGILPRTFLGLRPVLQSLIRVFGGALIATGAFKICIDAGWIDSRLLSRYAFPGCLIVLGSLLLLLGRRRD